MKHLFLTLVLVAPLVGYGQMHIRDRQTGDTARVISGVLQTSGGGGTSSTNQNLSSVGGTNITAGARVPVEIMAGATSGETVTLTNILAQLTASVLTNQQSLNVLSNQLAGTLTTTSSGGSGGISNAITSFALPITAVAYTAGQVAGGLNYFTNTGIAGKSTTFSLLGFTDYDNQKPNMTVVPFFVHPAARAGGVAAYTNAQLPTMLGDMLYSVPPIRILSSDWTTFNDAGTSRAFVSVPNLGRDFVAESNNVPFIVILDSATTYTQTTNLVISASFQK